jgi:hypothetical protein
MNKPPDDDLFSSIEKARGALPPGEYVAELVTALPLHTPKTRGAIAIVKIMEGEYRGREIQLRFVEEGPSTIDGIIARDAAALRAWSEAVGAEGRPSRKDGFEGALKLIWDAGRNKRVVLKIDVRMSRAGVSEMFLVGVRLDDYPDTF